MQNATLAVGLIGFLRFGMLGRDAFVDIPISGLDWTVAAIVAVVSILLALFFDNDRKKSYVLQDWLVGGFGGAFLGALLSAFLS